MKIRFISDIHYYLNYETEATELLDILNHKEPADVTLIAGDCSACLDEMDSFLNKWFPNEKVIFINGNHSVYFRPAKPMEDIIQEYRDKFNGNWKFLENDYVWLNDDIAVIGCIGWTDFLIDYETKSQYVKRINKRKEYIRTHPKQYFGDDPDFGGWREVIYTDNLPDDPALYYEESLLGDKKRHRAFRMRDAQRGMNDYNYGVVKYRKGIRGMTAMDTYKWHRQSLKAIKRCYNEIIAKNPNATIILMTHHPFVKNCVSPRYKDSPLNASFVSNHNNWLKKFPNIKYLHCGHVHQRFFKKVIGKQLICNPMGYIYYGENKYETPFNINLILDVY